MTFNVQEKEILLNTARNSIAHGLEKHAPPPLELNNFPKTLLEPGACFVTLHLNKALRGCIGSLVATQPLIVDVTSNAFKAAFQDPRFQPLQLKEFAALELEISVLSKPIPMPVTSEADLIAKLKPGIHGLILSDHGRRATFLPSVWEQLPNPNDFVIHLKNKAGWPNDYWSHTIQVQTYTAELLS